MASWRVGILAAPEPLYDDLMKIQDTVIVCAPAVSQVVALRALEEGRGYCRSRLPVLAAIRTELLRRLAEIPLLVHVPPSRGAFYLFVRVETDMPAIRLSERLIREHRVAVIPGETFGVTEGCWLRISYGSLGGETAAEGIDRLVKGLRAILGR